MDGPNKRIKLLYVLKTGYELKKSTFTNITTNTALTILRFCGQYLQMADTLRPVAFEVIKSICSLYDLYVYSVFAFFTEKEMVSDANKMKYVPRDSIITI